ncbi:hypothetical protein NDN08_002738 [Rhodosorus marinus]|uniref:Endopeptidase S2P n=1 Tax=Rhodosorus marinus TaxID=101924 RepID=A0AAV8UUQ7_9RHOD|nr:hypothetical protein NDN08_002738 [Rhodosorus marinus]
MVILIWALLLWIGVFALIKWLEVRSEERISRWLDSRNISLYLGYVSWTTTRYDAALSNISHKYRRWWDIWFSLGVTFGLVGLIFSVILLVGNFGITFAHVWMALTTGNGSSLQGARTTQMSGLGAADLGAVQPHRHQLLSADLEYHSRELQELDPLAEDGFTDHYVNIEFADTVQRAEETMKLAGQDIGKSSGFLTPLLPGINLPKSQLGYILFALLVSALFHELGHALAAGTEELRLNGVGGFLALIFPGAYVQIDGIDQLTPWRQLKVYCAGAWHNVAVSITCVIAIAFLPITLFPFYSYHHGAVVTGVPDNSPLQHHIFPGDVITAINQKPIHDYIAFHVALQELQNDEHPQSFGFCFSKQFLKSNARAPLECCALGTTSEDGYQCFSDLLENQSTRVCVQPGAASQQEYCTKTTGCNSQKSLVNATNCFFPVLPDGQQLHNVSVFNARKSYAHRHVIFQGTPETLRTSVMLSNYLPRVNFLLQNFPSLYELTVELDFPRKLDRLFQYTFSVSLCLAILNMAPVFFLDGEASAILFVRIFRPRMADWMQQKLKTGMLIGGTVLLAGNIVLSLAVLRL